VIKKKVEKILRTEIQCMQNVNTKAVPIITGATGPSENHSENT
jgi:hypothetical protein